MDDSITKLIDACEGERFQAIRNVDGLTVVTQGIGITTACFAEFEAGTNGLAGGDSGNGSRTYIGIEFEDGFDADIQMYKNDAKYTKGVIIEAGGDCELISLLAGFRFIFRALEDGYISSKKLNSQDKIAKSGGTQWQKR